MTTRAHEIGHAIVASELGWAVERVRVRPDGYGRAGYCDVISPAGVEGTRRRRELALIAAAGRASTGWTGEDGDRGDLAKIADLVGAAHAQRLRSEAEELLSRPSCRARARRLEEALGGRDELSARQLRDVLVHGKRVRPAWYLAPEQPLPTERQPERVASSQEGSCTRGTGMLVSTQTFGAIDASSREHCLVTAHRTRVSPDHWLAREYTHAFRAADPDDATTNEALRELVARSRTGQRPLRTPQRAEAWRL